MTDGADTDQGQMWDKLAASQADPYGYKVVPLAGRRGPDPQIEWPPITPLKDQLLPVEAFEPALLPEPLRDWVMDIAQRMDNAPADYAAVAAMTALGSLLGRKVGIHPKQRDDWLVVPNVWGVCIGRPSVKKTPSCREALKPLQRLELDAQGDYQQAQTDYGVAKKLDALQTKAAEDMAKAAVRKGNHEEAERILADACNNCHQEPTRRRYVVNNATVEKLGELLAENPAGLLQFRDELTGWLNGMERQDRGEDRAFYLEAWDGLGHFVYDRIGRGTIDIPSVTVGVLGGIQPGKLLPYLTAQKNGAGDDGFIERMQLMVYPDQGEFKHVDRWPNTEAKNRAYKVFQQFAAIPYDGETQPIRFSREAQIIFNNWYSELMARVRGDGLSPQLESHLSKYPSLLPSIALVFHIAESCPDGAVGKNAVIRAIGWAEYLESHARRVFGMVDDPAIGARILVERLPDLDNPFTKRQLVRKCWTGLADAEAVQQALDTLCAHGYLYPNTAKPESGGRSTTVFYINPQALEV